MLSPFFRIPEIKTCGLGFRIRDVEAFWYKTEIKIIVQLFFNLLLVLDCMVYPDTNFFIFRTKPASFIFWPWRLIFLILWSHARHLQQIHWNKLLYGMYGLMIKLPISRLNICQILMRYILQIFNRKDKKKSLKAWFHDWVES